VQNAYILVGTPERERPLGELVTDGRVILRWILEKLRCEGVD
jgi:hypothetical protein